MSSPALNTLLQRAESLLTRLEAILPHPLSPPDWSASIAYRYRKRGGSGFLQPVAHVARIALTDLQEVGGQKERLVRNTRQFVEGAPANNVLLTGARGTGKSSLIKACPNEFHEQGLRLIEVDKADLVDLPDLVDLVAARPERFGLWISFYPFSQDDYLAATSSWLTAFGVAASKSLRETDARNREALQFALQRGSRSGRVAWQFAKGYAGAHGLKGKRGA
jgi:predicted AAA+ superfamily ATPase